MPEVVINGEKDASIGSGATPPNTVIVGAEEEQSNVEPSKEKKEAKSQDVSGAQEPAAEGPSEKEAEGTFTVAGTDMSAFAAEYERDGHLSEDSYKQLADKGFPRELVDAYIRGLDNAAGDRGELAQKDVDAILAEAGGEERYNKIMAWAAEKLSKEEQDAYDDVVTSSNPAVARLAVQGLIARYEKEKGHEPRLVMGRSSPASIAPGFKDRSSMIAAMNDKRYGTDPEYTRDVERKVIASGLMRGRR